jgi:hypothetical protein
MEEMVSLGGRVGTEFEDMSCVSVWSAKRILRLRDGELATDVFGVDELEFLSMELAVLMLSDD